jgi:hypothetical protein
MAQKPVNYLRAHYPPKFQIQVSLQTQHFIYLAFVQVYDLETSYLQDSSLVGNVLKGFEGFLASSKGGGK